MVNAKVHLYVLSVDQGLLTGKAPEAIKFHRTKGCADIVLPTGKSKAHVMAYTEKQDNPRRTAHGALKKSLIGRLKDVVSFARIEDPRKKNNELKSNYNYHLYLFIDVIDQDSRAVQNEECHVGAGDGLCPRIARLGVSARP